MANNGLPNFSQQQWATIAKGRLDQTAVVKARAARLDPTIQENFNAISAKYPNMSKDAILAAVQKGITADMEGLSKIATADGLAQLISDKTRMEELPKMAKKDKFFGEALLDNLYAGFKGFTRVGFAALQHPYQVVTNAFRNIYAVTNGEITADQAAKNIAKVTSGIGAETTFGSLVRDMFDGGGVDTGTGFFIDPKSKVGKAQQDAFAAYGLVNGKSYTIGRGALSGLGAHPNSTFYRVTSGIVDATLNIALDPTMWIPGGQISGIAKGGAKAKGAVEAARSVTKATREEADILRSDLVKIAREKTVARKEARRTFVDGVNQNLDNLTKKEQAALAAQEKRALKILTAGTSRAKTAETELIDTNALTKFVSDIEVSGTQNDVISALGRLASDNDNTAGIFDGQLFFDELPSKGVVTLGAQGSKEFLVTVPKGKNLRIVDLAEPINPADVKSLEKWVKFSSALNGRARSVSMPYESQQALRKIMGSKKTLLNKEPSELVSAAIFSQVSISSVLKAAISTKDENVIEAVASAVQKVWKADGYSNVRSAFGRTGGVVITNPAKIAARQVNLSAYLTGTKPSRIAANTMTKIDDILANSQRELEEAKAAYDASVAARKNFDDNIKAIRGAREEYLQDPQALRKAMSDPEDIGIAKYVDLEEQLITGQQKLREAVRAEAGLINEYGGSVAANVEKALNFVLGKNFEAVSKVIADEKSFVRVDNLLGRKAPAEMVKELADAETVGQVQSIFLKYLGALDTDPIRFRGTLLRMAGQVEKATNPFVKIVPSYRLGQALAWAEKSEQRLGSFFVRTAVLPLEDLDRLVSGLRDWTQSAGISDELAEKLINDVVAAPNAQQRSGAVFRAIKDSYIDIARQVTAKNPKHFDDALKAIQETFFAEGKDNIIARAYYPEKIATDSLPTGMINGGKSIEINKNIAHFEYQMLDDIIKLPDSREIRKLFRQYNDIALVRGTKAAKEILDNNLGDRWRTAQLAFRAAFIIRNVGEMQVRMFLSGHESLFNHPLQFLAMMSANPNGRAMQRWAATFAKYNNDLLGNSLINDAIEKGLNDVVDQHFEFLNRTMYSYGTQNAWVGKIYETVDNTSDRYHVALANTVSNFRGDRFIAAVARATTPEKQEKLLNELVNTNGRVADSVIDLIMGGKKNGLSDESFWAEALLLRLPDNGKLTPEYITPDTINVENLRAWLFDTTKGRGSVINALNNVTGGNQYLRTLIGEGEVLMPNGKKITAPIYKFNEDRVVRRQQGKDFKRDLISAFPSKDMTGSTVIYNTSKTVTEKGADWGPLNGIVDRFFDLGTRIENIAVYGPEFRMAFWDYAGKYATMLSTDDLLKAQKVARETLSPIRKGNKFLGRQHPTLRIIEKELTKRKKSGVNPKGLITLNQMNSLAGKSATKYTKDLFYDAARQRNIAAQVRIIFPFAQAQFNTISKWLELGVKNPWQVYKFGRAYNSLTQPGSSAIYQMTGVEYDENQGFFYKDEFGEMRFRYPLAGSIMGGLVGKNIDGTKTSEALQFTAPVQALNMAFGAVNPLVPGVGPMGQFAMRATGKDEAFGPGPEFFRKIILPFGVPAERQGLIESFFPSWLNKSVMAVINDDKAINRNLKPWAEYLASTEAYGDNPLADDVARTQLFDDARQMSKWTLFLQGIFQSIAPATPSQEVFAADKDGMMRTQTLIYKSWEENLRNNPGNYYGAVRDFVEEFGAKNLLTILGSSTRAVQGTEDAWTFLNNNPEIAKQYAVKDQDIVPYFFAGGTAAMAYYNWQVRTGQREKKTSAELEQEAEALVYAMKKDQIENTQKEYGKSNLWFVNEVRKLGPPPIATQQTNVGENRIAAVGKALQSEAFKESPVYEDTLEFYNAFMERKDRLSTVRTSVNPSFGGKTYLARTMQKELDEMATQIMLRNPAFTRMYYGVFAGQLKVEE